jgi:hypothetical protein
LAYESNDIPARGLRPPRSDDGFQFPDVSGFPNDGPPAPASDEELEAIGRSLDWPRMLALAEGMGWAPRTSSRGNNALELDGRAIDLRDRSLLVGCFLDRRIGWRVLGPAHARLREDLARDPFEAVRTAKAVAYAIGAWSQVEQKHHTWFSDFGGGFQQAVEPIFRTLDEAAGPIPAKVDAGLRVQWLRFAWMAWADRAHALDAPTRDRLRVAAGDEFGRLRPLLRRAHEEGVAEAFAVEHGVRETALGVLWETGTLWQTLKQHLLAFRALSAQSVANDGRYWSDDRIDPGPWSRALRVWSEIPMRTARLIHAGARREHAADEDLLDARNGFATYALSRLKSADASGVPAESDACWRCGWIRAVTELGVNPEGKGHRVLHHAMRDDPDPSVRHEATRAYERMRHGASATRIAPRTRMLGAFMALRRAHLESLGVEPDLAGMDRTRAEERRRTTESGD